MHEKMANVMDTVIERIKEIKAEEDDKRPIYPMIILKTPKGWTGPKEVEGKKIEGSFRAHQVPMEVNADKIENLKLLEDWMKSYKPEECFDENGHLLDDLKELIPEGDKRMGASPYTNGGKLLKNINLPDFKNYMLEFDKPGSEIKQDMIELGKYLRDVIKLNPDIL